MRTTLGILVFSSPWRYSGKGGLDGTLESRGYYLVRQEDKSYRTIRIGILVRCYLGQPRLGETLVGDLLGYMHHIVLGYWVVAYLLVVPGGFPKDIAGGLH